MLIMAPGAQMASFGTTLHSRAGWMDIAKGFGIVLVVLGHAINGLWAAGVMSTTGPVSFVYFVFYTFHMPLFFLLSGMTVAGSLKRGRAAFLSGKLLSLGHPYLVWSIIQGLSAATVSNSLNSPFKMDYLYAIYYQPIGHFWFLYALMMLHLVAAASNMRQSVLIAGSLIALAMHSHLPGLIGMAAYHLCFYAGGILLSDARVQIARHWQSHGGGTWDRKSVVCTGIAAICASALAAGLVGPWSGWQYMSVYVMPSTLLGLAGIVMISQMPPHWTAAKVAAYLGQMSLPIYVMHVMACAGTRIALVKLGVTQSPALLLLLTLLAGVILPLAATALFRRAGVAELLGLQPLRRSGATAGLAQHGG